MAQSTQLKMSELKKKYKQLSAISDEWFTRIKKIFVNSKSFNANNDVIFVTNDDMVYGFGDNIFAILGIEEMVKVCDPIVIEELCGKDIKKIGFFDGFMVALTESHELYTGGLCLFGRCGNGINALTFCKPGKILIENQLIVDISSDRHYTVLLTDKQQVYTFGSFSEDGSDSILTPTLISLSESGKITSISCGVDHALALSQTGKVYAWGCNEFGQLGLGHTNNESEPELIEMPNNVSVKQISCGNQFSLLLTIEGNIYSFGRNSHGQMGLKNTDFIAKPTLIETTSKFTEIFAFEFKSFAMNESNIIEFWGQNIMGANIFHPKQTKFGSLQEAIIHHIRYPFTIEPIILNNVQMSKPIEANKCLPSNRVLRTMFKLFNNPENYDFKFKIKRNDSEDRDKDCPSDDPNNGYDIIYCHKWIVAENCEHLEKMFSNIKSFNETEIKGYSYETYFHFIQYLYTDSIETEDIELLNDLLLLSDMYSEEELKIRCISVIKHLINVQNVCSFYCSAITNKSSDLEKYCFNFMARNMKTIVKTKNYSQMDPKIAKRFLSKYFEEQK